MSAVADIKVTALDSLLAAIVESSDDAIISKDLSGTITSWNKGAERIFGYTREEAVGRSITLIGAPGFCNEALHILERIKNGERVEHYETVRRAKDGRRVNISLSVSPIFDEAGVMVGASKIARDITERKIAEDALEKQASSLVRANADLQEFAYITSHDLLEPLRTIRACTEMFLKKNGEKLTDDEKDLLQLVAAAGQRMSAMVSDLLGYSRMLTEDVPMANVPISEVLDWARNNLHLAVQTSNAQISCREMPIVRGNRIALVQLFQNLLSNAIKYRRSEPVEIRISAERKADGWLFAVRDNGIGIDPTYHQCIFRLFQRLHSQEFPGTGIGLTLCRKIVQAHGGKIWVESEVGMGATFFFTLPAPEAP
jgi:PAS domain S-box-containing protein